jgi:hypothetical protein
MTHILRPRVIKVIEAVSMGPENTNSLMNTTLASSLISKTGTQSLKQDLGQTHEERQQCEQTSLTEASANHGKNKEKQTKACILSMKGKTLVTISTAPLPVL